VVFKKQFIPFFLHLGQGLPHVVGVAVGGHEVELGYRKPGPEPVDILFPVQFKQIPGIGEGVKGLRVDHAFCDDILNFAPDKAVGQDACIAHAVGRKQDTALFCDPDGFRQGF